MKNLNRVIWGVILIAVGVLLALNAFNITDFDIFFDGWWTLFIIIPCFTGLFTEREKTGNIIGIAIGAFLLLCCQEILDFSMLWKLIIPAIIILLGLKLIFGISFHKKADEILSKMRDNGNDPKICCATFSNNQLNYDGEIFDGAELTATFGGIKCDLRNAIIDKDCAIKVSAVFGGIDILVSDNVNVKVSSNSVFGGITNKTVAKSDAVTLYVTGNCIFGGVEIK